MIKIITLLASPIKKKTPKITKKGRYTVKVAEFDVNYDWLMHIHHMDACVQFF